MSLPYLLDMTTGFSGETTKIETVNGRNQLIPQDAAGNRVAALLPCSTVSGYTQKALGWLKEIISGEYATGMLVKTVNPSIKFGTDCLSLSHTSASMRLPLSSAFQNSNKWTIDFIYKPTSVAAGTKVIMGDYFLTNASAVYAGYTRWKLERTTAALILTFANSAGATTTLTTAGLALTTTDLWRVRITYNGADYADASCTATISAAIDGNALTEYATSAVQKKIVSNLVYPNFPGFNLGVPFYDLAAGGYYFQGTGDLCSLNEVIFYKNLTLSSTATPSTTALLPFPTTGAVYKDFDLGAPMAINAGAFYSIDETDTNARFRISAGDTTGPALSGATKTYAQMRALGSLGTHRYIRFEVNCPSPDGLTQVTASPCYIGVTPASGYPRGRE